MTILSATKVKLPKVTETLLAKLDARSRDVVTRRFGIKNGQVETLESIGKQYGITRERVRQIEHQAKKAVSAMKETLQPAAVVFENIFSKHGGILEQGHLVSLVKESFSGENLSASHVLFYLEILPPYVYVTRDAHFAPHWRFQAAVAETAPEVVEAAKTILKDASHPLPSDKLIMEILARLKMHSSAVPVVHIEAQLTASKDVQRTPFGEWGLKSWSETNPRGVGDKAYAVLRRHAKPEHFTRITELINEAAFDHKRANAQTVHNELIKDRRFVLVGRGLYGLAEWGYIPGTVADVLEQLLAKAKQPLSRDELIEQVLAQRQVKKNTILLGLQNESRFVKTAENRYTLKGNP